MADPANAPIDARMDGADVRPVVATGRSSNLGLWVFLVALVAGGAWLFSAMDASRMAKERQGPLSGQIAQGGLIQSPPPLALPGDYAQGDFADRRWPLVPPPQPVATTPPRPAAAPAREAFTPPPRQPPFYEPPARPQPVPTPQVIFNSDISPANAAPLTDGGGPARVTAGRLANPALTVPQGTVIPAVLETAIDSTRAGGVRALVQRDVYGFDGSRVLVPRGSRLYGEAPADLAPGQKRAVVRWTRLLRPDGVTIALDSPAADPLGRTGVKGKVDSKFFQRFGGAILQSVLDIGVGVATRKATDGVVVALPGSTQNVQISQGQNVQPTLKVQQGTSVSVFVARDLDFSTVDR